MSELVRSILHLVSYKILSCNDRNPSGVFTSELSRSGWRRELWSTSLRIIFLFDQVNGLEQYGNQHRTWRGFYCDWYFLSTDGSVEYVSCCFVYIFFIIYKYRYIGSSILPKSIIYLPHLKPLLTRSLLHRNPSPGLLDPPEPQKIIILAYPLQ